MKFIIDINEEYYELLKHDVQIGNCYLPNKIIANGIPLEEELKKIRSELLSECPNTNARMICQGIIEKHIFKLKEGEEE